MEGDRGGAGAGAVRAPSGCAGPAVASQAMMSVWRAVGTLDLGGSEHERLMELDTRVLDIGTVL